MFDPYLATVLALALLTRLSYFVQFQANPHAHFIFKGADSYFFWQGANAFAAGDWLARSDNNTYAPLYKYFVGILVRIFGPRLNMVWSVQMLVGVGACGLFYLIAQRYLPRVWALAGACLFTLYGPEIMYEGLLLREFLVTFLALLSLWACLRLMEKPDFLRATVAGISLSLFLQIRPNTLFVVLGFGAAVLWALWREHSRPQALRWAAAMTGCGVLLGIPLLIQCAIVWKHFVFYDNSGHSTLIIGNMPQYSGVGYPGWNNADFQTYWAKYGGTYGGVLQYVREVILPQPGAMLALYSRKIFFLLNRYEIPTNYNYYLFARESFWLRTPVCNFSVFAVFGILGLALVWRERGRWLLPMIGVVGFFLGLIPVHNEDRFRLPWLPFLLLLALYGLQKLFGWAQEKRFLPALVFIVLAGLGLWALRIPNAYRYLVRPNDYTNTAIAYLQRQPPDLQNAEMFFAAAWARAYRLGYDVTPQRQRMIWFYNGTGRAAQAQALEASRDFPNLSLLKPLGIP